MQEFFNFQLSAAELPNLFLAFILSIAVWNGGFQKVLLALFVYGSLHFSFAVYPLFGEAAGITLKKLHIEGGGVLAKFSAFFLLLNAYFRIFVLSRGVWKRNPTESAIVLFYFFIAMAFLFFGYILNIHLHDSLQLKNVISLEAFLLLLLLGQLCLIGDRVAFSIKSNFWIFAGIFLLIAMDGIAIYEVVSHRSWAGTLQTSGEMVFRASATLFNPNLFAFWSSLVYLGCAYAAHEYSGYQKFTISAMVLTAIAIYFSGSRSAGYLLLSMLLLAWYLVERRRWYPLVIFPLTMVTVYVLAKWVMPSMLLLDNGWREIWLLGERFALAPGYVINYLLTLLIGVEYFQLPNEIKESINGRFDGGLPDAGWFVLFEDAGWLGVVSIFFIFAKFFPLRVWPINRSPVAVYGLVIFCYCLASGFVMRFQIFPVWVFIGVVLIQYLALSARGRRDVQNDDKLL